MPIEPIEILGLFAGFFTAFATLPQTLKIIKMKQADAVSVSTFSMLLTSYVLWFAYGLWASAISIIFWNMIGIALGALLLYLKLFVWNEGNTENAD